MKTQAQIPESLVEAALSAIRSGCHLVRVNHEGLKRGFPPIGWLLVVAEPLRSPAHVVLNWRIDDDDDDPAHILPEWAVKSDSRVAVDEDMVSMFATALRGGWEASHERFRTAGQDGVKVTAANFRWGSGESTEITFTRIGDIQRGGYETGYRMSSIPGASGKLSPTDARRVIESSPENPPSVAHFSVAGEKWLP